MEPGIGAVCADLQETDPVGVQTDLDVTAVRFVDLLNVTGHLSQESFLNPSLHNTSVLCVPVPLQVGRDDGGADRLGGVNDLLDTGNPQSDMWRQVKVQTGQRSNPTPHSESLPSTCK